jgi:hypothetical protein
MRKIFEKKFAETLARKKKSCTFAPAFDKETEGRQGGRSEASSLKA